MVLFAAALVIGAVGVLAFARANRAVGGPVARPPVWQVLGIAAVPCLAVLLLHYRDIVAFPFWSEELGWVEIARLIARGDHINPFMPKSDYPSSFQAFALVPFALSSLSLHVASKLAGVMLLIGAAYYFCLFVVEVSGRNGNIGVLALASAIFSLSSFQWFLVTTGWHEVTHVNFIVFACWYYCLRCIRTRDVWPAVALGFWVGVACWTLYTPVVFAAGVSLCLLLLPPSRMPVSTKLAFLMSSFFAASPILAVLCGQPELLGRHQSFYLHGGDGVWSTLREALPVYVKNLNEAIHNVLPLFSTPEFNDAQYPHMKFPS